MSAPVLNLSETNGAPAGTVTNSVPQIAWASADIASTSSSSAANPISAGNNSMEKYERLQITSTAPNAVSGFSVYFNATAITDAAGSSATVTPKFAVNATYAQPVATASSVATTNCSTVTSAPGTSFTAPANTANAYSGYIVLQLQTTSSASGGNAIVPSPFANFAYSWS